MDKTSAQRQQRYREQISEGKKRRVQVVLDRREVESLEEICLREGISKTEFIRQAIAKHKNHGNCVVKTQEDKTV